MKTIASLATLLSVIVIVAVAWRAGPRFDETAATLWISPDEKDFGTVAPGQHLQGGFSVRNGGSRRMILHQDGASCCGEGAEPLVVSPGETATVPVNVLAPTQPGPFEHTVSFTTNDPDRPRFEFVVRALVSQPPGE